MTYLDRQFCSAYGATCATHDCYRAMNKERQAAAKKWIGYSKYAGVAYGDMSNGCGDKTEIPNA